MHCSVGRHSPNPGIARPAAATRGSAAKARVIQHLAPSRTHFAADENPHKRGERERAITEPSAIRDPNHRVVESPPSVLCPPVVAPDDPCQQRLLNLTPAPIAAAPEARPRLGLERLIGRYGAGRC